MSRTIQKVIEVKEGNKWTQMDIWTNPKEIYDSLAHDLISKKICGCTWIRSIKCVQHYDGFITITVTYGSNCRAHYTITDH